MIGETVEVFGATRSRSVWSLRLEAKKRQELPAVVRGATEILEAIVSTSSAQAAPDGPNGPVPCASSARRVRGYSCCHARRFGMLCIPQ
eukprot:CAMPEP_0181197192 /NCGR_PEP_ID=MMETSP1096-20121128/15898_1 /TAXON_ID=156174 ORGANISM="Chrysochromulina ericina, Strain CCMP281" /NCGR_SAMPLE_ID=MMETSP1096 /ASSEMBLY_ACC=CAM_ASM_000453 /LENGTH=88 /DNA_ID=CAMNT_0023287063 /DNA_START=97 /DNA_END=363 /DNA_ORIENTATION=-